MNLTCSELPNLLRKIPRPFLAALTIVLGLTGCEPNVALQTHADFGKRIVAELQAKNFAAIETRLDLALQGTKSRAKLIELAQVLPSTTPTSIRIAGLNVARTWALAGENPRRVALTLQYQFTDKWFLVSVNWRENERGFQPIDGIHITPISASLETVNRFTLEGKAAIHYLVLALTIVLPIFTVFVLGLCLTTPLPRLRKALWALAIFFGVTALRFNWTTSVVDWQPLFVLAFSASYLQADLGPAILSISVPLGAIIFVLKRRSGNFVAIATPRLPTNDDGR